MLPRRQTVAAPPREQATTECELTSFSTATCLSHEAENRSSESVLRRQSIKACIQLASTTTQQGVFRKILSTCHQSCVASRAEQVMEASARKTLRLPASRLEPHAASKSEPHARAPAVRRRAAAGYARAVAGRRIHPKPFKCDDEETGQRVRGTRGSQRDIDISSDGTNTARRVARYRASSIGAQCIPSSSSHPS